MGKERFTVVDFKGIVPKPTINDIIYRAKQDGYCEDYEEVWGNETRGVPRKAYKIEELRAWINGPGNVTPPVKEKIFDRLKELETGDDNGG